MDMGEKMLSNCIIKCRRQVAGTGFNAISGRNGKLIRCYPVKGTGEMAVTFQWITPMIRKEIRTTFQRRLLLERHSKNTRNN